MKKIVSIVLCICTLACMLLPVSATAETAPALTVDTSKFDGMTASAGKVYEISTAAELFSFRSFLKASNTNSKKTKGNIFVLTADIDLNEGVNWASYNADPDTYTGVLPTNKWATGRFYGTLDGQGHTVTGLWHEDYQPRSSDNEGNGLGLFSMGYGATIQNLVIGGGRFSIASTYQDGSGGDTAAGTLIGSVYGAGDTTIQNCYIHSDFTLDAKQTPDSSKVSSIGGLIGSNYTTSGSQNILVQNTVFDGTFILPDSTTKKHNIGLFAAKLQGSYLKSCQMKDCMFTGTVSGDRKTELDGLELWQETWSTSSSVVGGERCYTSQPQAADTQFLAKHNTYGVLPVAVADMLSDFYWQDDTVNNNVRLLSEVNSLNWDSFGYDITLTRTAVADPTSVQTGEIDDTTNTSVWTSIYQDEVSVRFDNETVKDSDGKAYFSDLDGVAIYGVVLEKMDREAYTYTVTVTPTWIKGDVTIQGASRTNIIQ